MSPEPSSLRDRAFRWVSRTPGNPMSGSLKDAARTLVGRYDAPPGKRAAPTIEGDPLLGHVRFLKSDPLRFLLRLRREAGDVARFRFGPTLGHLLSRPEHVQHVLADHAKNYSKQTRGYEKLRLVMGNGLLTSEGDFWLRQRRIAQPAFHKKRIEGFTQVMVRAAEEVADRWGRAADAGSIVDIDHDMMGLTLRIVCETLLGTAVEVNAEVVDEALSLLIEDTNARINSLYDLPLDVPTLRNRRFVRSIEALDRIVYQVIEAKRRERGDDLVSMLIETVDEETGERMTDAQLRDEVMTIFLAGHETTANALSWAFYELSSAPHVRRTLEAEVDAVCRDHAPSAADLPKLVYTGRVMNESMRLHPPAWLIGRGAIENDVIDGFHIPAGTLVFLSPYVTHRHPDVWDSPQGFDPDRFTKEADAQRHRYAFFPFGGGARLCIGRGFALAEGQLVLAALVRRFRIDLLPDHPVVPDPLITMRPRFGMKAMITRR